MVLEMKYTLACMRYLVTNGSMIAATSPIQALMPYSTISGLFVEIWTVCSPEEAHGNKKALVNACPFAIVWIQRSPNIVLCQKNN